ncbi:hypothetical protein Q5752_005416 [Cryptotrichosporon argae]
MALDKCLNCQPQTLLKAYASRSSAFVDIDAFCVKQPADPYALAAESSSTPCQRKPPAVPPGQPAEPSVVESIVEPIAKSPVEPPVGDRPQYLVLKKDNAIGPDNAPSSSRPSTNSTPPSAKPTWTGKSEFMCTKTPASELPLNLSRTQAVKNAMTVLDKVRNRAQNLLKAYDWPALQRSHALHRSVVRRVDKLDTWRMLRFDNLATCVAIARGQSERLHLDLHDAASLHTVVIVLASGEETWATDRGQGNLVLPTLGI